MGCIYCATNKINGKKYIGQTAKTVKVRRKTHERDATRGSGIPYFYNALRKYGFKSFKWEIIFGDLDDDDLDVYEVMSIRKLNTLYPNGYNLRSGGAHGKHSEETKKKMSLSALRRPPRGALSEEHKKKIGLANSKALKGKKQSPELIKKRAMSLRARFLRGEKRKPNSGESRRRLGKRMKRLWEDAKFRERMKGRRRGEGRRIRIDSIYLVEKYESGCSLEKIAKEFGCDRSVIRRHLVEAGVGIRGKGRWGFRKVVEK